MKAIDPLPYSNSYDVSRALLQELNARLDTIDENFSTLYHGDRLQARTLEGGPQPRNAFSYSQPVVNVYDFLDPLYAQLRLSNLKVREGMVAVNAIKGENLIVETLTAREIAAGAIVTEKLFAGAVTSDKISVNDLSAIKANLGTITSGNITLDSSGFIRGGATGYETGTGFWMGYSGAAYKFFVGDPAGHHIKWDGSALTIVGGAAVTSVDWRTQVTNRPLDNNGTVVTSATPAGAGLFLGANYLGYYNGTAWRSYLDSSGNFYLGGSSGSLQWNGTTLLVNGTVQATGGFIGASSSALVFETAGINTGSSGSIRGGQTAYNTGTGYWMGYSSGYKFSMGSPSGNYLTWDGSALSISGSINIVSITGLNYAGSASAGGAANSISGQGALATKSSVDLTTEVTNKSLANLDSTASSKLGGIADGATVGATWGTNLYSIPATLSAPSGSGLYLSSSYMGFYDGGTWRTYIDNSGNLSLGNYSGGGAGLVWNQAASTLAIRGAIVLDSSSSVPWTTVSGATKPADNATVGATWGTNLYSIPTTLSTPSSNGLYLSSSYMGYYASGAWKTYIDNNGNLLLGDYAGGGVGLSWNQSAATLSIRGTVVLGTSSTVPWSTVSGTGKPADNADVTLSAIKGSVLAINSGGLELSGTATIKSSDYVADTSGWRIHNDGSAEFQNVKVRGTLVSLSGGSGGSLTKAEPGVLQQGNFEVKDMTGSTRVTMPSGDGSHIDMIGYSAGVPVMIYGYSSTGTGSLKFSLNASSGSGRFVAVHDTNNVKVVGTQQTAISTPTYDTDCSGSNTADTNQIEDNFSTIKTSLSDILTALRNHGLIAT